MTLGDLYPDVRLYSEVETIIMTGGGGGEMGGTYRCMGGGGKVGGHMEGLEGMALDDLFT